MRGVGRERLIPLAVVACARMMSSLCIWRVLSFSYLMGEQTVMPKSAQLLELLSSNTLPTAGAASRDVKLHATVLNTRYRRPAGPPGFQQQQQQAGGAGRPRFDRQPFDGRPLLGKYMQADFGVVELPALHLSQRGRYAEGGPYPGFYSCADSLPLRPK